EPAKAALLAFVLVALPTIAVLLATQYKNRGRLESERVARLAADKDDALSAGFYESGEGRPEKAVASFERALSMEGSSAEAVLGIALTRLRSSQPQAALEVLDAHRDLVGGLRGAIKLRVVALRSLGKEGEAARLEQQLPPCSNPVDFYIEGEAL